MNLVPGDDDLAAKTARMTNSYAAELKKKYPEQIGYWASLPLPNIDLALKELKTAFDEGADGIALETNHHGHYLGDEIFEPLFEELNRRKAIVFIHPTMPCYTTEAAAEAHCTCSKDAKKNINGSSAPKFPAPESGLIPATPLFRRYAAPMFEFFFDTARCLVNLFLTGTVAKYTDITYIASHAGGCFPPLIARFTGSTAVMKYTGLHPVTEEECREALNRQFYFDVAGMVFPGQLVGLVHGEGFKPERLVYGSDYPFTVHEWTVKRAEELDEGVVKMFNKDEIEGIYWRNAQKLLDRMSQQ